MASGPDSLRHLIVAICCVEEVLFSPASLCVEGRCKDAPERAVPGPGRQFPGLAHLLVLFLAGGLNQPHTQPCPNFRPAVHSRNASYPLLFLITGVVSSGARFFTFCNDFHWPVVE